MESWQKIWREGAAPLLSTASLEALLKALETNDPHLIQGSTTPPPPLQCVQDRPVEAACLLGYCGWQGEGLETVAEVEEYFANKCFEIDQRTGEPAAWGYLLTWWDDTPRMVAFQALSEEVKLVLAQRQGAN